jgi:hypothetical protein
VQLAARFNSQEESKSECFVSTCCFDVGLEAVEAVRASRLGLIGSSNGSAALERM